MSFCNMERADLTGAVADGAIFCGARMVCAVMEAVSMRGLVLSITFKKAISNTFT